MASISTDPNGLRLIQFVASDCKRKSIRLGRVTQKQADKVLTKVEALNAAAITGDTIDKETAAWVRELPDKLHKRLAKVSLVQPRGSSRADGVTLGVLLAKLIERRTSTVKPNTLRNLEQGRTSLVGFFGADRPVWSITEDDADAWQAKLQESYAGGTIRHLVKRARQFFRSAVRAKIVESNPFDSLRLPSACNPARQFMVSREAAALVLDACPTNEWRLIFALSRYGGLRCPSEHLALTWGDVDWERGRFRVNSPKTGVRWVPIFPELRPHLEKAFEAAPEGAVHVIGRHRDKNANLRTQFQRIIDRAGLKPWPKLFHNLRATRQTELAAEYPIHVVCAWLGNTELIAAKHYLQVTENDFQKALQKAVQSVAVLPRMKSQGARKATHWKALQLQGVAIRCEVTPENAKPR